MKKILSICLPTYNRAETVYANVLWLLKSTNQEFEIVVSDNCSEDDTKSMLSSILDSRFRYFRNNTNYGASYNFHLLYNHAEGDYMLLMSDEDFVELEAIDYLIDFFRKNMDVAVYVGSGYRGRDKKFFPDKEYINGFDALMDIGFTTRYMSGIVMKRKFYLTEVADISYEDSAKIFDAYSFMYAMSRLFFCGRTVTDSRCIYHQNHFVKTSITNNATDRPEIYYFEPYGREKQMRCWFRSILTLPISNIDKILSSYKVMYDAAELALRVFDFGYQRRYQEYLQEQDYQKLMSHISSLSIDNSVKRIITEGKRFVLNEYKIEVNEMMAKKIIDYVKSRETTLDNLSQEIKLRNMKYVEQNG